MGGGGCTSLPLVGNSGCLTQVRHSNCKSSTAHSYQCVQYFGQCKQWYMAASIWDLVDVHTDVDALDCTQGLYRHPKTVFGGCTDILRQSLVAADSGSKNPLPHQGLKPASVLHLAFQSEYLPPELSPIPHS